MKSKVLEWIIVIIIVIVLFVLSSKVAAVLGISMRSARYLILLVAALIYYLIDTIRNKKD